MTADIIDIDELNTGLRREGIFGAIYWWMVKVGFAIAGGLSGLIIALVGFNPELATLDQQGAVDGLHAFFCFFPMAGTILAIFVMRDYEITEEKANEIRTEINKRKQGTKLSSYYETNKLASLLGSKFSTDAASVIDFTDKSKTEIKEIFSKSLNAGMHGLCFSPYMEGQNIGAQLSAAQIQRRMNIVAPHTQWIRSFSCTDGNENIPKLAHKKGLKTMVGAWIGKDKEQNNKEIDALINLAKNGFVDVAVVGNEVLMREDLNEQEILNYIKKVKEALPNIPVGYVDAYYQFLDRPNLVDACDAILINCYPFWEGASFNHSSQYLKQMYAITKEVAKGKPVIITETGWPNKGESTERAQPSDSNAMKYFANTMEWSKQEDVDVFYFSSFDESWKVHHEGDVGARWGIWNKTEKLKY